MPTTPSTLDYPTRLVNALIAAQAADTAPGAPDAVAALMGRANGTTGGANAPWCVPWGDPALGNVVPIVVYQLIDDGPWGATRSVALRVRLSAFAPDRATADALIGATVACCTPQALAAGGADACLDPKTPPRRQWPPHEPAADDPAQARADVLLSFYLTPP